MKLKRVKIVGFKTFADRIEFVLDGDVIAVVGPNGCGKSNLVDAILWGLGESSTRSLRAPSSRDVIFAGSALRKPLGYAEVTLTFDNEDGALPLDAPEVSVTRRITRGGDSDYAINRRPCRQKDVHDLLADSGLGRAGYAIVGQNEIDQALAASPQQRRAWIDEAAGVHRYRLRRQEAARRLDSAQAHLQRVQDVVGELQAQLGPLEEEVAVARRYRDVASRLRELESGLLATEYAELSQALDEATTAGEKARADLDRELALSRSHEAEAGRLDREAEALTVEAEELRERLRRAEAERDQADTDRRVALARLESLETVEERLTEEAGHSAARIAAAEAELEAACSEAEAEAEAYRKLGDGLVGTGEESARLQAELQAAESALAAAREAHARRQRAEVERALREQRAQELEQELRGIDAAIPDLEAAILDAQAALAAHEEARETAKDWLAEADRARGRVRTTLEALAVRHREALSEAATLDGKRRGIEATIESHEGLAQGARAVLELLRAGRLHGSYRPLGECLEVESRLAVAIDTALGAAANDLVVPDEAHAKRAIALLKEERLGRATFQPADLVRPARPEPEARSLAREPGVVGWATDLVSCEPSVCPVIESLLGRVLVVERLDDALRLARTRGWSRIVTRDGEVVHGSGSVTGGRAARHPTGLVQRRAELQETVHLIEALKRELAAIERDQEAAQKALDGVGEREARAKDALAQATRERDEARAWLASLEHEAQATRRARLKTQNELESLSVEPCPGGPEVSVEAAQTVRDEAWRRYAAHAADAEVAESRLGEALARVQRAERRREEAVRRLRVARDSEAQRARRQGDLEPERARHRRSISDAEGRRDVAAGLAEGLAARMAEKVGARAQRLEEARTQSRLAQEADAAAREAEARLHETELTRARLDLRRAAVLERLLDEYGLDAEAAFRLASEPNLPADAAQVAGQLRRELKAMGEVNFGTVELYERLSERHAELSAQVEDIQSGRDELLASVEELDRMTARKFRETFARVQEEFARTFHTLFGGGDGALRLVPGERPNDDGVEVEVTVPGKKRQNLSLLSGGERAMSAIAFLFALLRVKPSPLVILDEVDAPLDGRNVERFVGLLRGSTRTCQFIVVTHNPVTMESADYWFGVTMQEPGVSALIPFRTPPATPAIPAPGSVLKG